MSPAFLVRFLLVLAVLFAPIGMMSGHAAMAMPQAGAAAAVQASDGHCADMAGMHEKQAPADRPADKNADCVIACACVPPAGAELAAQHPLIASPQRPGLFLAADGLSPQAEPPPPRLS